MDKNWTGICFNIVPDTCPSGRSIAIDAFTIAPEYRQVFMHVAYDFDIRSGLWTNGLYKITMGIK